MAISKKHLKTQAACKVKFRLSPEEAQGASALFLVGDFNNWSDTADPMKQLKDGSFSLEIKVPAGQEYQFRYRTGDNVWFNDPEADALVPSEYGGVENSLLKV
jgi:1,4-alpha-glucan branching enzyme